MSTSPPFLEGFVLEDDFATATGVCSKTLQRYRNQPDGLPHILWGGKVYIGPLDEAREWLLRRVKRPNPPAKRRVAA